MSAPPGLTPVPASADEGETGFLPTRIITRELAKFYADRGIYKHPAELRQTVNWLRGEGIGTLADLHHRLDHADPTGSDAVAHAMTGRREYRHSLKARS